MRNGDEEGNCPFSRTITLVTGKVMLYLLGYLLVTIAGFPLIRLSASIDTEE